MSKPSDYRSSRVNRLFARLFFSCKEMTRLASDLSEQPQSWFGRLKATMHRGMCVYCRRYAKQILLLRGAYQKLGQGEAGPETKLSNEARERILQALKGKR